MNRKMFMVGAITLSSILALLAAFGLSPRVAAQSGAEAWTSSAEAPAGTALEQLSPADHPVAAQDDVLAPEALISWRVTGSALKPRENDVSYATNSSGACTYVTAGDASTVWNIPVILPQGTEVDTLRMYYYDTSGSNSSAWFTVYDPVSYTHLTLPTKRIV